jgi:hypothetical protein
VLTLEPATDVEEVRLRLEMSRPPRHSKNPRQSGARRTGGPRRVLDHLGVADQPLAPLQLLGLARCSSVGSVVDRVRNASVPLLAGS